MDGFKSLPKMQHFKTGGSVKPKEMCYGGKAMKKGGEVDAADIKQDKAIVKKAFGMHDKQEHHGEKTDLSKLKKGGRAKKDCGTVRKYKTGGSVENVYGAKKKSGDLDRIEKTKDIKPGKAAVPSKASEKPAFAGSDVEKEKSKPAGHKDPYIKSKESGKTADAASGAKGGPNKYKTGGKVKKYEAGGSVLDNIMGSPAQNKQALANEAKYLAAKRAQRAAGAQMTVPEMMAMGLAGAGQGLAGMQNQAPATPAPAVQAPGGTSPAGAIPAQKRGGKVKKMNTGGTCP
jgi:hypothetical protein